MNVNETKTLIKHIHSVNSNIENPISINIEGKAGIGKTAIVKEIAKELNLNFVKINISQLDEVGDLIGFPIVEYKVKTNTSSEWIPERNLSVDHEVIDSRTVYAKPAWITDKPVLLLLDDFNRANNLILQAVMDLIYEYEYFNWKLPKGSLIVLTSNPEDGDYNISYNLDEAQRSRYFTIKMDFDFEYWKIWALSKNYNTQIIDFIEFNQEMLSSINIRQITRFMDSLGNIEDLKTDIDLVTNLAKIAVNYEFAISLKEYIENGFKKIPTIEEILGNKNPIAYTNYILRESNKSLIVQNIISDRLISKILKNEHSEKLTEYLYAIFKNNLFSEDILYKIGSEIIKKLPRKILEEKYPFMLSDENIIKNLY